MSSSATSVCGRPGRAEHLVAAADLGHDLDVGLEGQQRRQRLPDHRLVLGEQQPDHGAARGGLASGHVRYAASTAVAAGVTGRSAPGRRFVRAERAVATSLKPCRPARGPDQTGRRPRTAVRTCRAGPRRWPVPPGPAARWLRVAMAVVGDLQGQLADRRSVSRIRQFCAPECRITLVTASRRHQASAASASGVERAGPQGQRGVVVQLDPGRCERVRRGDGLHRQRRAPVAADRLPDVVQRLAADPADVAQVAEPPRRFGRGGRAGPAAWWPAPP